LGAPFTLGGAPSRLFSEATMKRSGYMTRALKAHDPRFARVLGKLAYGRSDLVSTDPAQDTAEDDLPALRKEYEAKVGKKAYHGWDVDALRAKIAEA